MIIMLNNFGANLVIWALAILYLWMPSPGFALKCHVCNSLFNESCEALPDNRYLIDCQEVNDNPAKNHTNCRKEIFSVSSPAFDMSSSRTIRTCGYEKHPKFNCFYNSNHDIKETICECVVDGCNRSVLLHTTLYILISLVLSTIFMSYTLT